MRKLYTVAVLGLALALAGCARTVDGRASGTDPVTVTVTAPTTSSVESAEEAPPPETEEEETAPETPPSVIGEEEKLNTTDCDDDGDGDGGAIEGYSDKQDAFVSSLPNAAGEYVGCDDALTVLADYYAERPEPLENPEPIEVDGASCNQGSEAPNGGEVICVWDGLVFFSWFAGGAGAY